jgi:hypothetical protein
MCGLFELFRIKPLMKSAMPKHANKRKAPLDETVQFVNPTTPEADVRRNEKNRETPLLREATLPKRKAIQGVTSPRARE